MVMHKDVTEALVTKVAEHHDRHPEGFKDFRGPNGLVLRTTVGWSVRRDSNLVNNRIAVAVRALRNHGTAGLRIGDGTSFVFVTVRAS